jgi:hypothetical protein
MDHSCRVSVHVVNNLWRNPPDTPDVDKKVENGRKPVDNPCG